MLDQVTPYLDHMDLRLPLAEFLASPSGYPYNKVTIIHSETWSSADAARVREVIGSLFGRKLAHITYQIKSLKQAHVALYPLRQYRVVFIEHALTSPMARTLSWIADTTNRSLLIYHGARSPLPEQFNFESYVVATTTTARLKRVSTEIVTLPGRARFLNLVRFPEWRHLKTGGLGGRT